VDSLPPSMQLGSLVAPEGLQFCISSVSWGQRHFSHCQQDSLGFVAPITMQGLELFFITFFNSTGDGDRWRFLKLPKHVRIPRCYVLFSPSSGKELCIFSDASTMAIRAVAYLKAISNKGQRSVGFIMGKSKLTPKPAHTSHWSCRDSTTLCTGLNPGLSCFWMTNKFVHISRNESRSFQSGIDAVSPN